MITYRKGTINDIRPALDLRILIKFHTPNWEQKAINNFFTARFKDKCYFNNLESGQNLMSVALDGDKLVGMINEHGDSSNADGKWQWGLSFGCSYVWKHNCRGKWETTGSAAIAGDNSLTSALREAKEGLGLELNPAKEEFFSIYEMHTNSGAHLYIHRFFCCLNDGFLSVPIDYRVSEPAPYESYEEYLWFSGRDEKGVG